MDRFEFATATRVVFGSGAFRDAGELVRGFGRRALVVTGRSPERGERLRALLGAHGVETATFSVEGEPSVQAVQAGADVARQFGADLVLGLGGGSAMDAAKTIAALATADGELLDYLEIIGKGRALTRSSLPCVAIPTTAGTGSEVTRNAVLTSDEHHVKVSLRSAFMLPSIAIVDPELTVDLPPALTARTGFDALTQLIEPFLSNRATPMADALCRDGIRRAARSLRRAVADGHDMDARCDMALASLFSGMALTSAGLGAVHALAAPIGGLFSAPHGAVCAALLPHVMAGNLRALETRASRGPGLGRFGEVARLLVDRPSATARDGVEWLRRLVEDLGIPSLRTYGLTPSNMAPVLDKATRANSMKSNPIELTVAELTGILGEAL